MMQSLRRQTARLPQKPGVYIFKDEKGDILYVGKAKALRNRVISYFNKDLRRLPRTAAMVKKISSFDFSVTANEVEALILESNLIKRHKPPYNVFLRDDKSYPWLVVTMTEKYPRLALTRDKHIKGNRYFGPYTDVSTVRKNLDTLRKIFPLRNCRQKEPGKATGSPCLNFHIKRCLGPCVGDVEPAEYNAVVTNVLDFLEGRTGKVIASLEHEMNEAAGRLEFEEAARIRNRISAARSITHKQDAITSESIDMDVIGLAQKAEMACLSLFQVRAGKMIGTDTFIMAAGDDDVISAFIKQYYIESTMLPREILVQRDIDEQELIKEWLRTENHKAIKIKVPKRGQKHRLVELARDNAGYTLELTIAKQLDDEDKTNRALVELTLALGLAATPSRIECFDVSNISGAQAVSSMAVFENGSLSTKSYRRFKIHYSEGPNDFMMMFETIKRRLDRLDDEKFGRKPDLILVDGGKPQLSAAVKALRDMKIGDIEVASMAKKEEEIFRPGQKDSIRLEPGSPALFLVQRLRDEAHRFAVNYHRHLRSKKMVESDLDAIPGIGPDRRMRLLARFTSLDNMRQATVEELEKVLPKKTTGDLFAWLHEGENGEEDIKVQD